MWKSDERVLVAVGALYLACGAGIAVVRDANAFEHGWWLVAYLVLVGALAQLALGLGALRLLRPVAGSHALRGLRRGLILWNVGVPLVPLGVFTDVPGWVGVGGVLELFALCLLGTSVAGPARGARPTGARAATGLYLTLVFGLALSAVIGMRLGGALPS